MVSSVPLNILAEEIAKEILVENVNPQFWLGKHYLAMNWHTYCSLVAEGQSIYNGNGFRDIISIGILMKFTKDIIIRCRKTDGNRQNKIIGYFDVMLETQQYQNSNFIPIGFHPFFMIEINEDQKLGTGKAWLREKT